MLAVTLGYLLCIVFMLIYLQENWPELFGKKADPPKKTSSTTGKE